MRIRVIWAGLQYRLPIWVDSDVGDGAGVRVRARAGVRVRARAGVRVRARAGVRVRARAGVRVRARAGVRVRARAGVRVRARAGVSIRCQGSGQPGSGGRGFDGPRRCTSRSAPTMAYSTVTGSDGTVRELVHAGMVQPNIQQSYGAMPGVNTRCRAARFRLRVLILVLRTCRKRGLDAPPFGVCVHVHTRIAGGKGDQLFLGGAVLFLPPPELFPVRDYQGVPAGRAAVLCHHGVLDAQALSCEVPVWPPARIPGSRTGSGMSRPPCPGPTSPRRSGTRGPAPPCPA